MSTTIYHSHHIVPRHMDGTNDKSNLVKLTVTEHAEAHRKLYEEHNKLEDKLAWKMLEGQAMMGENLRIKSKLGWAEANKNGPICLGTKWYYNPEIPTERKMLKDGATIPEGWVHGRGLNTWSAKRDYKSPSDEHRKKTSEACKKMWKEGKMDDRKPHTITQAVLDGYEKNRGLKREKKECPHCGKLVAVNVFPRWHGDNCKSAYYV